MLWLGLLCLLLLTAAVMLGVKVAGMRRAAREIEEGFREKLGTDTNTLITVSTSDRTMRRLANTVNIQLRELRTRRHRFAQGDVELKTAVTNISHDLRTPLTAICGYLDLLEKEAVTDNAARYIAVIRERTKVLTSLTEELFRYSIITSGEEELRPQSVSLNHALEESLTAFYGELSGRGIVPEICIPEQPVIRSLDPAALYRVFGNILGNVLKYSDGDLSVTLTEGGKVTFSNHASSLDKVRTAQLFHRFYTVAAVQNSTGLGLSIAKTLTERMGGSIQAEYLDGLFVLALDFSAMTAI